MNATNPSDEPKTLEYEASGIKPEWTTAQTIGLYIAIFFATGFILACLAVLFEIIFYHQI